MNKFHEEIKERIANRHKKKVNTWLSLLLKIIILTFLVMVIKNLKNNVEREFGKDEQIENVVFEDIKK